MSTSQDGSSLSSGSGGNSAADRTRSKKPLPTAAAANKKKKKGKAPGKTAAKKPAAKKKATVKPLTGTKARTKKQIKKEEMAAHVAKNGKRPPNFTSEEDVFLCRAFVNVSTNSAVGADQKGVEFWRKVRDVFTELYKENSEVQVDEAPRPANSLENRWARHISCNVSTFNRYYKAIADNPPSGFTAQDYIKKARDDFAANEGKPFNFIECIPILHKMPKFDPFASPESIVPAPAAAMGASMDRPQGQKKAKKAIKEAASLSASQSTQAKHLDRIATATDNLANVLKEKVQVFREKAQKESIMQEAQLHIQMGNMEEAARIMKKLHEQPPPPPPPPSLPVPDTVDVAEAGSGSGLATEEAEEAEEEEVRSAQNVDGRLPTVAEGDEQGEANSDSPSLKAYLQQVKNSAKV